MIKYLGASPPKPPKQTPKKKTERKTVIIIIAIVSIAVVSSISIFQLVIQPLLLRLGQSLGELSGMNLTFMEAKYNPTLNFTIVKFGNIGRKTLFNITVVSEFGEINPFPLDVKREQWFQVGLKGMVSKATVQYATEPNGTRRAEDFEWNW